MLGEKSFKVTADKELATNITSLNFRSPWSLSLTFNYQCYFYLSAALNLTLLNISMIEKSPLDARKGKGYFWVFLYP